MKTHDVLSFLLMMVDLARSAKTIPRLQSMLRMVRAERRQNQNQRKT